jgi:hypothetical protein
MPGNALKQSRICIQKVDEDTSVQDEKNPRGARHCYTQEAVRSLISTNGTRKISAPRLRVMRFFSIERRTRVRSRSSEKSEGRR